MVFDYYSGGSGDEITVGENRRAWQQVRLRPRVLVDVGTRDLRTTVLGQELAFPVLTAPCAFNALAASRRRAGRGARATAGAGIMQVVSTAGTYRPGGSRRRGASWTRGGFNSIAIATAR